VSNDFRTTNCRGSKSPRYEVSRDY